MRLKLRDIKRVWKTTHIKYKIGLLGQAVLEAERHAVDKHGTLFIA